MGKRMLFPIHKGPPLFRVSPEKRGGLCCTLALHSKKINLGLMSIEKGDSLLHSKTAILSVYSDKLLRKKIKGGDPPQKHLSGKR